jgi:hypothetical protein
VTAAAVTALSTPSANSAVYVTNAVANAVTTVAASAAGESGKLRAQIREASTSPGIVKAALQLDAPLKAATADFSLITPRAASDVRRGKLGLYYIGTWPGERKAKGGAVTYAPPSGFVEVTPENENTPLSQHFRLRDFLTHDQPNVWPKYEVVSLKLVDKLELVLDDLKAHGIDPDGVHVMSGFRTPQYNAGNGAHGPFTHIDTRGYPARWVYGTGE